MHPLFTVVRKSWILENELKFLMKLGIQLEAPLVIILEDYILLLDFFSLLRKSMFALILLSIFVSQERVNAGLPTSIAASTMIAVGTSHGLVLVFDSSQTLRWCLGAEEGSHSGGCAGSNEVSEFGAVSALSLNHDCSRLLVGFAKGAIFMYDLTCGRLLRTLSDAHPPATAVLHLKVSSCALYIAVVHGWIN